MKVSTNSFPLGSREGKAAAQIVFNPALVEEVGSIGDLLDEFMAEQVIHIQALISRKFADAPNDLITNILDQFATLEGTRHPLLLKNIKAPDLDAQQLRYCLVQLVTHRILRFNDGIYELTHDKLAERIAANRDLNQKNLIQIKGLLERKLELFREEEALLTESEINYIEPYIPSLRYREDFQKLFSRSVKHLKKQKYELEKLARIARYNQELAETQSLNAKISNAALWSNVWLNRKDFNKALLFAYAACKMNRLSPKPIKEATQALTESFYQPEEKGFLKYVREIKHKSIVRTLRFSSDEQLLLTITVDNVARLYQWDGTMIKVFDKGNIIYGDFSPDSQTVVTATDDGAIQMWDAEGKHLATLSSHRSPVKSIEYFPDGAHFVSGSNDLIAIHRKDGAVISTYHQEGHEMRGVKKLIISPAGTFVLVLGPFDHSCKILDPTGKWIGDLVGHTDKITYADISPDNRHIATSSADKHVIVWDIQGRLLKKFVAHTRAVAKLRFSPDGNFLVTVSKDNTAKVWTLDGKPELTLEGHTDDVNNAMFSKNGAYILTTANDNTAKCWNRDGSLFKTLTGHQGRISDVEYLPDSNRIITASSDTTVKFWDIRSSEIPNIDLHQGAVNWASFAPDDQELITVSSDHTARIWTRMGGPLYTLPHETALTIGFFSPDGRWIVTHGKDKKVYIWDRNSNLIKVLGDKRLKLSYASFTSDGRFLVTATTDQKILVWDQDFELQHSFVAHKEKIYRFGISPDGAFLVTASKDNTAKIWKLDGALQQTLTGHKGNVHSAFFSPDGQHILTASEDGTACIWDLDGRPLRHLTGHPRSVSRAIYSPDGEHIVTLSMGYDVRLWNKDGRLQKILDGHKAHVNRVSWSFCSEYLATASYDHTVMLWTRKGHRIKKFSLHQDVVHGAFFSRDSRQFITVSKDSTARILFTSEGIFNYLYEQEKDKI